WPAASGLATDSKGFIAVNDNLQSTSHPFVFAGGDIASQLNYPRPKAGVYAVRQAPVLFANVRRALLKKSLRRYQPQKTFLSLLSCADGTALGCRPGSVLFPTISGPWVWRWKDRIDRRFMRQFSLLSEMPKRPANTLELPDIENTDAADMRCGGCGTKVGGAIIDRVLKRLRPIERDGVEFGVHNPDDASAFRLPVQQLLVQSVDVFRALLDDPYVLGQIAAEHALSDLFAMHAQPHSALAIATLPYAHERIVERDLLQLMAGAIRVLNTHNCALLGGHTSEGAELSIGFSVNGLADENKLLRKSTVNAGDVLILTQPLGIGTLFAAHAQLQANGAWIEAATTAMLHSSSTAGEIVFQHQASACTDITGFGLLGHLVEMLTPSKLSAELALDAIPSLDGARHTLQQQIYSSLQTQNQRVEQHIANANQYHGQPEYALLFDPQTSGGLLASIPAPQANKCLSALHTAGYAQAAVIGRVMAQADLDEVTVLLN
ncbi:MAG: selenide, water dikinase SelD, partial [Pseudomonadales bacterium]